MAVNPFTLPGEWLKGNTHCHTTQSDGDLSPEAVADWYAGHGYDFLAFTDHRILTSTEEIERAGMVGVAAMELNGWDDVSDCEYHMVALGLKNVEAAPPGPVPAGGDQPGEGRWGGDDSGAPVLAGI